MLEYIFFDRQANDRFVALASELGLSAECSADAETLLVKLPEEIDDAVLARIEQSYDELMELSESAVSEGDERYYRAAGLQVDLPDGRQILVSVEPDLLNKLLRAVDFDELGQFAAAIAAAALNPDERPICKR